MDNEWKVQNGNKKRNKLIRAQLRQTDMMSTEEAKAVRSVWDLSTTDRWRLYRLWVDRYVKNNVNVILEHQKEYKKIWKEFEEIRVEEDINLMREAKVVGMTTSGAAKYRNIVQKLKPLIVVVEEAAEVLEAHIITSLTAATQHLILIGDHQQLRPSPTVYELAKKYNLELSLFERLVENGMECSKLMIQHRMRPEISMLLTPHIYKDLYNHPSVKLYGDVWGMNKNVFFVNHDYEESNFDDSKSKHNIHEADFLVGLCKYLLLQGYSTSQLTVLTMYTGQVFLLKKKMANSIFSGVRVTAVDNFQGEENDIILVSFVRSNDEGKIGFLSVSNRICVALSRAKKGLYCIGNFSLFAEKNNTWNNIMTTLRENSMLGSELELKCRVHPEKCTKITNGADFTLKAPEGGCDELCFFRLDCGHACPLFCHPYDREHKNLKCKKRCEKKCTRGHECPKMCYEECGLCKKLIRIQIPSCGHYIWIPCFQNPSDASCNEQCPNQLPCGHQCPGICSKPCLACNKKVNALALCSHKVEIMCSKSNDEWEKLKVCERKCNVELNCGHTCKGNCGSCIQYRIHVPCTEKCNRILVCGHECKFPCAKNCPPCERKCDNYCNHSYCRLQCGQKCSKCKEPCTWKCKHLQCSQLCGDNCNRPPCNEPCEKKLKCGHPCIGFCGEKCPKLCRTCNEHEVTEIFFGTEDEPDARFIQLEDCIHIFEVTGLTQFMETGNDSEAEIQMKSCPRCKKVIRRNHRFGDVIKTSLQKIELVKEKVCGVISDNEKLQEKLLQKANLLRGNTVVVKSALCELKTLTGIQVDKSIIDSVISSIYETLNQAQILHSHLLVGIENYLMFLANIIKVCKDFSQWYQVIQHNQNSVPLRMWEFFSVTMQTLLQIMNENKSPTEHLLYDINKEMRRLSTFNLLFQLTAKTLHINNKSERFKELYDKAVEKLLTFGPLKDDKLKEVKDYITKASEQFNGIMLGISNEEKEDIIKAMGLSKGHWFSCPNGHVYCITECGGAMELGRCNECKAAIGGQQHTLRADNRLAGEMDNATHAAWSDAANMQNYDWHLEFNDD